jgi:hypothetical protein
MKTGVINSAEDTMIIDVQLLKAAAVLHELYPRPGGWDRFKEEVGLAKEASRQYRKSLKGSRSMRILEGVNSLRGARMRLSLLGVDEPVQRKLFELFLAKKIDILDDLQDSRELEEDDDDD